MNRIPVISSNLRSVGYDKSTSTLEVEFHHGGIYQYFDVPEARYAGLMSAYSHGRYFDAFVKGGGYSYRQAG